MPITNVIKNPSFGLALAILAGVFAGITTTPVAANGAHSDTQEVFSGDADPYFVRATTAPVVGTLHWTLFVSQLGGEEPVPGVALRLSGVKPDSDLPPVGPVVGRQSLAGPNFYTVDIPVETAGPWIFTVTVESDMGISTVDIPLTVVRGGAINFGIIGVGAVVLVIGVLIALSWRKRRKAGGAAVVSGRS